MYQTVDPVVDKSRSPELQRDELSTLILNGLFSGEIKARSIIRDQVKKLPIDKIANLYCLPENQLRASQYYAQGKRRSKELPQRICPCKIYSCDT